MYQFLNYGNNLNSVHQSLIYGATNCIYQSYDYGNTIFIPLTTSSIMVPQSSFHLPLRHLWCHNLHSTYHFVSYGATIFIPLTTSSFMVPQSSFLLPLRHLWCHNLHSTYHFVSCGATIFIHLPVFQLRYHNLHSTYLIFSYGTLIFCPCTSLSFVMQHSSFLLQRNTCRRDYSNSKETGRRKCKLYNDMRIFFFASGICCCPKIFAHPILLCYVQPCVIFIAAK